MKWKKTSGVLCDKRIQIILKGKFHKTSGEVRVMMLGSECWAVDRKIEQRFSVYSLNIVKADE